MAQGDFHTAWRTHGIVELDRLAAALEVANREIALRLEREGEIVGEVSHQLRSRLTAIQLRLDELSLHPDPHVVEEAEAAHAQAERLNSELDELIAVSRDAGVRPTAPIDVDDTIDPLVHDFSDAFVRQGREVVASYVGDRTAWATHQPAPGGRVRPRRQLPAARCRALHGRGVRPRRRRPAARDRPRRGHRRPRRPRAEDLPSRVVRGGSSGVGLSLARALVEADGGRLELTTRVPAAFTIVVPTTAGGPITGTPGVVRADGQPALARTVREPR